MATGPDRPVTLAAIAGAHGVRGEVRLKLFAEGAESLRRHRHFGAGGGRLTLVSLRKSGATLIARFAELSDRTAAEAMRGTVLTVPRSELPPLADGEYYWHDLIGLAVVTPDGADVGQVTNVENFGASDLIDVKRVDGSSILLPLVPDAVLEVGERIVVAPEWLE